MNTPERKKLMNEPIENTPQAEKKRQREGMLSQNTSHRDLSEDLKYSTEEDDNKPTAAMKRQRVLISQVKNQGNKTATEALVKDMDQGPSRESEGGGILEMFGLAGGRRRRRNKSKRNKRMARKSRRRSRRKSRRGGYGACPAEKCPCPRWGGKDRGMCVRERANGRGRWFNYKYGKGKKYDERQAYVNANEELKAKRADFVAEGKAIASRQAEERKKKEEGFSDFARGDGALATAAAALEMTGVKSIVGGRRRKSRRKKRRKSKKRKSRRRRSRRRRR